MRRRITILVAAALLAVPVSQALAADAMDPGGSFIDDDGNVHEGSIEAIAAVGITRGCNPPEYDEYCPDEPVTRGAMAAFIVRALDLPPSDVDAFGDDEGHTFENDINALAASGITKGCNPPIYDSFCPNKPVTRGQMAAFLDRAFDFPDPAEGDHFDDDNHSIFEANIDRIASAGITLGCNPPAYSHYCPDQSVRRDQMATFLMRAAGLSPLIPPERCHIFPADNIWNARVDDLPVDANSDAYISTIGAAQTLHADFGSGEWPPGSGAPIGIPFVEVDPDQPLIDVDYTHWPAESDPGPLPIPLDAPIEGGPAATGDRHVIAIDRVECKLYELFHASPTGSGWEAANGAVFDLTSNDLRPDGWTSADAAGLPILPGLVTYDEVASGEIAHAIRFTAPSTRNAYVWPARHYASNLSGSHYPPMGQRFRLKAGFDISGYSPEIQVILTAMKRYGIILADNGSPWYISGAPDGRWDNSMLHEWDDIPGSAFEAVDVSSLMVDADSGQAG